MTAGVLRNQVTLMRKTRVRDVNGGFQTSWQPVSAPIAANVVGINGKESIVAEALKGVRYYQIKIRYRSDISDADQLRYGTETLNVRSACDEDGRRRYTMILADTGSPEATS